MICKWLEEIAPLTARIEKRPTYWAYTQKEVEKSQTYDSLYAANNPFITAMDPDAVVRQGASLASEDRLYYISLLKCMFNFIRKGDLLSAQEVCQEAGQPWRAASISGGTLVCHGDDDDGKMSDTVLSFSFCNVYNVIYYSRNGRRRTIDECFLAWKSATSTLEADMPCN